MIYIYIYIAYDKNLQNKYTFYLGFIQKIFG